MKTKESNYPHPTQGGRGKVVLDICYVEYFKNLVVNMVSEALKQGRTKRGFATAIGISYAMLRKLERGDLVPHGLTIAKAASELQMPIEKFTSTSTTIVGIAEALRGDVRMLYLSQPST